MLRKRLTSPDVSSPRFFTIFPKKVPAAFAGMWSVPESAEKHHATKKQTSLMNPAHKKRCVLNRALLCVEKVCTPAVYAENEYFYGDYFHES